jgi:Uma2 family endonuclease
MDFLIRPAQSNPTPGGDKSMSTLPAEQEIVLGPESAGLLMTPAEFDAIEEYDPEYRYELIKGVVVVSPIPLADETGPNDLLGQLLLNYQESTSGKDVLDGTLPQQYVYTRTGRRIADRLIWTGLGRVPNLRKDRPTIAVEFVSGSRRDRQRDYVDKRREYAEAGIRQYWIIDRFQRTLTVVDYAKGKQKVRVITEHLTYESPLLPEFILPVGRILEAADRWATRK